MSVIGIIPARYASSRFPAKPLVNLKGKPMIQHVYERVKKSQLDEVWVATDHAEIKKAVESFGGKVLMTDPSCENGTERCWDAIKRYQINADFVINIQGDEPLIQPEPIQALIQSFDLTTEICTLIKKIDDELELFSPHVVKCVRSANHDALYFSREPIPHFRDVERSMWLSKQIHFKHVGIYGYSMATLEKLVQLKSGRLEEVEKLEQLRWIENGFHIKTVETSYQSVGIDTPEDVEKVLPFL